MTEKEDWKYDDPEKQQAYIEGRLKERRNMVNTMKNIAADIRSEFKDHIDNTSPEHALRIALRPLDEWQQPGMDRNLYKELNDLQANTCPECNTYGQYTINMDEEKCEACGYHEEHEHPPLPTYNNRVI